MTEKNNKPYLPNERDQMEQEPKTIKSYSQTGEDYTELPDPVRDPIVSNNISYQEFDYTDKSLFEDDEL